MQTIFWHDYETFGADPSRDRPCQFAGVRTDLELNVIEEPITLYCSPTEDYLPAPEACLVTGITPQEAKREGVVEAEFAARIHDVFSVPETCVAGYNSIRFDDEVSRYMFYRNFYDPYQREWMNGNSRWDLIDVVRLVYALRPETLNWPLGQNGQVSFRLELLTAANGISHEAAHDAMSDVYATIAIAKLIRDKEPKLFDWAFGFRKKAEVLNMVDWQAVKPLFHVSSKFPVSMGCCALVAPLFEHPANKNGVVVYDLRQDPAQWRGMTAEQIRALLYRPSSELAEGEVRPALKTVHVNKCPMLLPASSIKQISDERKQDWLIDEEQIRRNLTAIRSAPELIDVFKAVFDSEDRRGSTDPDLMLYSGGFLGPSDKSELARVRATEPSLLAHEAFAFQDPRLEEMLFRYKGRNYPETLSPEESERWLEHCKYRLLQGGEGFLGLEQFGVRLAQLYQSESTTTEQRYILEELQLYAESIVPFD